jgi:nicotinate-nucleotide--dimethylbenzimidazole phosphoribosyltransferase
MDLAGMTGSMKPEVARRLIVIMAGDHGVTAEGVSAYPKEVTGQMIYNFLNGGAGINAVSRTVGAEVVVVDIGVACDLDQIPPYGKFFSRRIKSGTDNMAAGPAMSREDAIRAVETGIDLAVQLSDGFDILGTGDMGIGNTTPSSAIIATLTGASVSEVTGKGTGIEEGQFAHKVRIIQQALDVNRPNPKDGIDVLSKVGGFEIGGIAGLILGAASMRKPVLVDGLISTAGALIAHSLAPNSADYMISAHLSVEQGHRHALDLLGKKPLLDLNMRLGEGTGAALAMTVVDASIRTLTEMATFEEAAVSGKL